MKSEAMAEMIAGIVKRRPMTIRDLTELLDALPCEVGPCLERLVAEGSLRAKLYQGRLFYVAQNAGKVDDG
jgi:hypothetical protein